MVFKSKNRNCIKLLNLLYDNMIILGDPTCIVWLYLYCKNFIGEVNLVKFTSLLLFIRAIALITAIA